MDYNPRKISLWTIIGAALAYPFMLLFDWVRRLFGRKREQVEPSIDLEDTAEYHAYIEKNPHLDDGDYGYGRTHW